MKRLFTTLIIILITFTSFGQVKQIAEFTTSHVRGDGIDGNQPLRAKFEIYADSVVLRFVEPKIVAYFKSKNMPTTQTLICQVKLINRDKYGEVYYFGDPTGEIILMIYDKPSAFMRVKNKNGLYEEKNFINLLGKARRI